MKNFDEHRVETVRYFEKAGIVLTDEEKENVEIAAFGLDDLDMYGLQLVTYVNTDRYCAKEMVLLPNQVCPEHRHPTRSVGSEGKRETFRCRFGEVHLFVDDGRNVVVDKDEYGIPSEDQKFFTASKKVVLKPGEQFTIDPDVKHWFVAREDGAVISEFSSNSEDESDIFTDPRIDRTPE